MDSTDLLSQQLPALRRLARALVGIDDADDLVQEVALAGLSGRVPLSPGGLATMLRRRSIDRLRRRGNRGPRAPLEAAASVGSRAPTPDEASEQLDRHAALIAALQSLPDADRALLAARYFDGATPAEIGARDDMPPSTVRSRLNRAVARLRMELESRHGPGADGWLAIAAPIAGIEAQFGRATAAASAGVAWKVGALLLLGSIASVLTLFERSGPSRSRRAPRPPGANQELVSSESLAEIATDDVETRPERPAVELPAAPPAQPPAAAPASGHTTEPGPEFVRARLVAPDGTPLPEGVAVRARPLTGRGMGGFTETDAGGYIQFDDPLQLPVDLHLFDRGREFDVESVRLYPREVPADIVVDVLLVQVHSGVPTSEVRQSRYLRFDTELFTTVDVESGPWGRLVTVAPGPAYRFAERGPEGWRYGTLPAGTAGGLHTVSLEAAPPSLGALRPEVSGAAPDGALSLSVRLEPLPAPRRGGSEWRTHELTPEGLPEGSGRLDGLIPGRYTASVRLFQRAGDPVPLRAQCAVEAVEIVAGAVTALPIDVQPSAGLHIDYVLREPAKTPASGVRIDHSRPTVELRRASQPGSGEESEWQATSVSWDLHPSEDSSAGSPRRHRLGVIGGLDAGDYELRLVDQEEILGVARVHLEEGVFARVRPVDPGPVD